jgi:hypothetical protein
MKPIRSTRNQYHGINAHLHSLWQAHGGWAAFHTSHINDLIRTMRPLLLKIGYDAALESSLQIRRLESDQLIGIPASDILIYRSSSELRPTPETIATIAVAEKIMPIRETLFNPSLSTKDYHAIQIYRYDTGKQQRGKPVAWIELLSPSNKPGGQDAKEYKTKRLALLDTGLIFVELDYLHESEPTLYNIPVYRRRGQPPNPNAHAYRIIVLNPHPSTEDGTTHLYEFDVDVPIPEVTLPLTGEDKFLFDFDAPYQKTLFETLYAQEEVNYAEFPKRFKRYNQTDQTRIARRMLAVLEAAHAGIDLETGHLPVKTISLEDALIQIATLKAQLETS